MRIADSNISYFQILFYDDGLAELPIYLINSQNLTRIAQLVMFIKIKADSQVKACPFSEEVERVVLGKLRASNNDRTLPTSSSRLTIAESDSMT